MGSTNDTKQERSINAPYLGRVDNGSGHIVFKLDTKAVVSVNRVVVLSTTKTVIYCNDKLGISEKQLEGIQFTHRDCRVSINNLNLNLDNNNNNNNISDKSFDHDKEYQKEFKKEGKDRDLATNEI